MQRITWCNLTIEQPVGVYKITNVVNSKVYIGSSINLSGRISNHYLKLRTERHENQHLQRAWIKYGEENFKIEILEYTNLESVLTREQYYLDVLLFAQDYMKTRDQKFVELSYNVAPLANAPRNKIGKPATHTHKSIKVFNTQTNEILVFDSLKATANYYGIDRRHLSSNLIRKHNIKKFKHLKFTYAN